MIEKALIAEPGHGASAINLLLTKRDSNIVENIGGKAQSCSRDSQAA
jgi:hypothetical protein